MILRFGNKWLAWGGKLLRMPTLTPDNSVTYKGKILTYLGKIITYTKN